MEQIDKILRVDVPGLTKSNLGGLLGKHSAIALSEWTALIFHRGAGNPIAGWLDADPDQPA